MEESNIDAPDDFVVVADKDSAEKETLKRLQTLVELITQALDSVNQSNLLLRDQVHSALCVTLQHTPSDRTLNTDEIIKALDNNVTSTEEVRSKYVRNLCSKLVDASAEISKLREEVESLKTSLERKESEAAEELKALISATQNIQSVIEKMELSSRGDSLNPSNTPETFQDAVAEPTSMRSLCADLVSICDRLSHLSIQFRSVAPAVVDAPSSLQSAALPVVLIDEASNQADLMTFPCSVQTDPMQKALVTNNAVQTDSVPTEPCSPQLTHSEAAGVSSSSVGPTTHSRHSFFSTNPFHEDDWASMTQISINQATSGVAQGLSEAVHASVNALPVIRRRIEQIMHHAATSPMVNPNVTQEARPGQTRGFSALDEEPWCPSCSQRFASRTDLEEHLSLCLQD